MRNYIILNGNISTNITGLLIQELPPISKPKMRTQVEEIDGRDGDIVTTLGYSAYDKEIKIGLFGQYDIDEIIAFFTSSGTVVFSNEEDKYYNYQILDQIDFERLIRFKEAIVKMHIQPFKYSVSDNEKTFDINYDLINYTNYTKSTNGITVSVSNGAISVEGTGITGATEFYIPIQELNLEEGDYTLSATASGTAPSSSAIRIINNSPSDANSFGGDYLTLVNDATVTLEDTVTTTETYNYLYFYIAAGVEMDYTLNLQIQNDVKSDSISIRNSGNIYSKPIMTITGAGSIEISLNGEVIFDLDMGSYDFMTIDTNLMEAYNGGTLLNRQVTGDYSNFQLSVGNNVISWTGDITQLEIDNYSRWI